VEWGKDEKGKTREVLEKRGWGGEGVKRKCIPK
jgi:hypothetical protein